MRGFAVWLEPCFGWIIPRVVLGLDIDRRLDVMRRNTGLVVLCVLWLHCAVGVVHAIGAPADRAEQWEQAAINREWAATAKTELVWAVAAQAEALRQASYADAEDGTRKLDGAAGKLRSAGDTARAAAASRDSAARNWNSAARIWQQAGQTSQATQAGQRAVEATRLATELLERAAGLYEAGVEIYADMGPRALAKMAALSEKAAVAREQLAKR